MTTEDLINSIDDHILGVLNLLDQLDEAQTESSDVDNEEKISDARDAAENLQSSIQGIVP